MYLKVFRHNSLIFLIYRKLNLLSFGEEAEEEEKELAVVKAKIKSSHDVLDDPRLLKEANTQNDMVTIGIIIIPYQHMHYYIMKICK